MRTSLSRRTFLQGTGVAVASAAFVGTLAACGKDDMQNLETNQGVEEVGDEFFCTCSWSCSFCQYNIYVRDGNVSNMKPKADYPFRTCLKGKSRVTRTYSEARIQYPMKRVEGTERGAGQWERITWEEAGELVGEQWKKTEETYGPLANSIYMGGGGAQGSLHGSSGLIMRMFNATGCTKWDYSFDAATNVGLTRGGLQWFDQSEPADFVNSDYIVLFGGNPIFAQIQMGKFLFDAQDAGAKIIVVDPHFSATAAKADKWVPVSMGNDTALFLGLIKRFIDEGTFAADFVLNNTCAPYLIDAATGLYARGSAFGEGMHVGPPFWVTGQPTEIDAIMVWSESEGKPVPFDTCKDPAWSCPDSTYVTAWDKFKDHVSEWTFDKVTAACDISQEDFDFLYNALQPENKVAHYINFGTGAYENGLHAGYAMTALIAMTGNFGEPGRSVGGFDMMYGNFFGHASSVPSNGKMVSSVTFLAACDILNSGVLAGEPYPVKTLWVSHGGLIGGSVNSNRVKKEFLDKMEMIIVEDNYLTDTARYADILLPACDMYEFEDVVPLGHMKTVRLSEKCIEPMYEAKPDAEIARFMSEYIGVGDIVNEIDNDTWWKGTFDDVAAAVEHGISMATLREQKEMRYVDEDVYVGNVGLKNFISETGRLMFYVDAPAPRTASNYDTSNVEREQMPTYFENKVTGVNSEYAAEYPLTCMSWRNPSRVHMTMFMDTWARQFNPNPRLFINPADGQKYGIEDGAEILASNWLGDCVLVASFNSGVREGCTVYYKGYAESETKRGSMSALTTDYADPYAVNCSFFDNRIKIEPWDGSGASDPAIFTPTIKGAE
ncbi:MAG: molybdopterin-dependent oxidoreductase [Actinobacteria bacterium]|nr:molybdopterin-dependent oxidoreductase [Actinomycetota bacterium]